MDKISENIREAEKRYQMAYYMLNKTYPLFNEPKVLLSISDHVFSSFIASVSALLAYERSKKSIPPYHNTNESKLNSFKQYLVRKYKLENHLKTIESLVALSTGHKESVIEFSRDKKFFMFGDQFKKMDTISKEDVKANIEKAKEFNEVIARMVLNG
jgi:hypothetical protein